MLLDTLVGHTDIVWGVKCHPQLNFFASISADSTIKIWNLCNNHSAGGNSLLSSMTHPVSKDIRPTSIDFVPVNDNQLLVSFTDSSLHLFDIQTCTSVLSFNSQETYGMS